MSHRSRFVHPARGLTVLAAVVAVAMMGSPSASAARIAQGVSSDPYTNPDAYHATEVEPDTFSFGSTIVATFQMGRYTDGGSSNIGFATSVNGGATWTDGGLPSLTVNATPPGPYRRATDAAVTYDAMHDVWMIVSLGSKAPAGFSGVDVLASRSTDGGLTWGAPVIVKTASGFQNWDKSWINCDNTATSPFYGHCYAEWDDPGSGDVFHVATSTDGGLTWTDRTTPSGDVGSGGIPISQPNGTLIVPTDDTSYSRMAVFISTDGGASLTYQGIKQSFQIHPIAGGIRQFDLLSADVDASSRVYAVWFDCRFRAGCASNDIVMSTSVDGKNWTPPVRIPIDPVTSTADHFLPGIAVEPGTSGAAAHLAVVYDFYPQAACGFSTCQLQFGFIESSDGGTTWSNAKKLAGPFSLGSLPSTTAGLMVGDYNSVSFVGSGAWTVFTVAKPGTTCTLGSVTSCNVPMAANRQALRGTGAYRPADTRPAFDARGTWARRGGGVPA